MKLARSANAHADLQRTLQLSPKPPSAPHASGALWLALEFPALPLLAMGLATPSSPPLAVSLVRKRRPQVLVVDRKAHKAGITCGMSVTAAMALCPTLQVRRYDAVLEDSALQGLAAWANRYTSSISVQPPRGLLLEIGGSVRLFGGLDPLLQALRDDLNRLGHVAIRGIATTSMAAWLLARAGHSEPVSVEPQLASALANVPVHCLDLPQRTLDDLHALGVHTFGECARLPRDGLTRRFGPGLLDVMDRALGTRADPRQRWVAPAHFERRLELAFESADRTVLMRAVELLLAQLVGFLNAHDCGAAAIELQLAHEGVAATRINLELVVPSRDPLHLKALLAQRVERLALHHQVLHLGMRVSRLRALTPRTGDLYSTKVSEPSQLSGYGQSCEQDGQLLIERLGARLGLERVCTLSRVADYRPERSSVELPWHVHQRQARDAAPLAFDVGIPLWLLPSPRLLQAGGFSDGSLVLENGPCRIESGWWDGDDVARDYYVARSARGSRYWIFRDCRQARQWYVHGLFA
ncbi:MAG: protein ImuB [Gammaproteobacteria bacterium]|jgi:protein ImuB